MAADVLIWGAVVLCTSGVTLFALRGAQWRQPGMVVAVWFATACCVVHLLISGSPGVINVGSNAGRAVVYTTAGIAAVVGGTLAAVPARRRGPHGFAQRCEQTIGVGALRGRLGASDTWVGISRAVVLPVVCATGYVAAALTYVLTGAVPVLVFASVFGLVFAYAMTLTASVWVDPNHVLVEVAGVRVGEIAVVDVDRVRVVAIWLRNLGGDALSLGLYLRSGFQRGLAPGLHRYGRAVVRRGTAIEITTVRGVRIVVCVPDARAGAMLLARHVDQARKTLNRVSGPKGNPRWPARRWRR
jgi:hypothetical protein